MDNFCIIVNAQKDENLEMAEDIGRYLGERQKTFSIQRAKNKMEGLPYHYTNPELIADDTDCIIVLGGDGTLLQAARDLVRKNIPLLGINMGHLGYLAEVDGGSVYPALEQLLRGAYEVEERMMLYGRVYRKERLLGEDIALNDIVISRMGPLRVTPFINYVNGEFLTVYHADGMIVSTPTGSTGYSLSAGGPIVSPGADLTILSPLAAHTLNTRSIVLPARDVVTIEIGDGRRDKAETAMAVFDGDTTVEMCSGDTIVIQRAASRVRIVKLNNQSFVEVLRQKMRNN